MLNNIYWHSGEDAELSIRLYIKKPEKIDSIKDIKYYENKAVQEIAEAEELIKTLQEYRQALYNRYQEMSNTNYKLRLRLERFVSYFDNLKKYIITIAKRFDGNNMADEEILRETYEGKERHKALKRLEALKKEYPNIETEIDIEKKRWER